MDPTAPDGCRAARPGWDGRPVDTARLRLRPLADVDAPAIVALLDDWQMVRATANIPFPYDLRSALAFLHQVTQMQGAGRALVFAVEERLSGELVGCIGATFDEEGAEVGYWTGRDRWGRGYATEALLRFLAVLFANPAIDMAWASVLPGNQASRRVVEKAGFGAAGQRRMEMPARGQAADLDIFRLARADWQAGRDARPLLLVAAAALVDADGRVLLARRPAGKSMAGFWEFPGGKIDGGETPEQALVRELAEELGIDVGQSCLAPLCFASHDYDRFHLLMPVFVLRKWTGKISPREGQELAWVAPARLASYPMPPADLPLVAILRDWL